MKKKQPGAPPGTRNGQSKLTVAKVRKMRRDAARGVTLETIAERMGVTRTHASKVINGVYWAHVT